MTKIHPLVENGATLLDDRKARWWKRVDPEKFRADSAIDGILGQLYGCHAAGMNALGLKTHRSAQEFGFVAGLATVSDLQTSWTQALRERKKK